MIVLEVGDSMVGRKMQLLKSILLLFGSFIFARYLSTFIHEHGHAIAAWVMGVKVYSIIFHPFSWSYVRHIGSKAEYSNFITWAGPLFAVFVGLLLTMITWRWRRPSLMPILMTGVVACTKDGAYLIISCLANTRGDGATLVKHGTPLVVVVAVGFVIFAIGIALAFTCLGLLGISPVNKVKFRILFFVAGIFPYLIAMLIYHLLYIEELNLWLIRILGSVVLVFFFAMLSGFAQRNIQRFRGTETKMVTWPAVISANVLALVIVVFLFFILPNFPPIEKKYEHAITYYDNELNFAGTIRKVPTPSINPYRNCKSEYAVFWGVSGFEDKVEISVIPYFAIVSSNESEVIVFAIEGVLIVPLDDRPYYWLYKHEDVFSMHGDAVNKNRSRALLYGFERSDSGEFRDVLIGLDLSSGYAKKIQVDGRCLHKHFIDNYTALVVMEQSPSEMTRQSPSEEGTLIKVEFSESGDISFTPLPEENTKDILKGVLKGKPVFHLDEERYGLRYDNQKIIFTKPIRYVQVSESHIWVVDYEGQVFKVKQDGSRTCLYTCDVENIIGCGTFDDNLWIAFCDGTVKAFGDTPITTKIELP